MITQTRRFLSILITAVAIFLLFLVQNVMAAPTVTIESPTASSTYNFGNMYDFLTVGGTATSTVDIDYVTYVVDSTGDFGTSTGTSTWSVVVDLEAVKDVITPNVVTITAMDVNGSSTTDVLTVNFNWQYPTISFASTTIDIKTDADFRLDLFAYNIIRASNTDVSILYDPSVMYYSANGNGSDIVDSSVATSTAGAFELLTLHSVVDENASTTSTLDLGWLTFYSLTTPGATNIVFDEFTIYRDSGGNVTASTGTMATIDIGDPTITIEMPTYDTMNYYGSSNLMPISGSATDNVGVSTVTFINDAGGSGTASSSGSETVVAWNASVPLFVGTNNITFTITDTSGNTATDTISVNYLANDPIIQFSTTTMTVATDALFSFDIGANYLSESYGVDFHLLYDPNKFAYDSVVFSSEGTDYSLFSSFMGTTTIDATTEDAYFSASPLSGPDNTTSGVTFGTFTFRALDFSGTSTIVFATSTEARGGMSFDSPMELGASLNVGIPAAEDLIDPIVAINYPTASTTFNYYSSVNTITLQGSSSDNVLVSSVTFVNSLGGSGAMTGTSTWTRSVTLSPGVNVITVTAHDSSDRIGTDTITINYIASNPIISFSTTTLTKATSTSFDFNVLGNYFSEAETIGVNIYYDQNLLTYSTSTFGIGINSALSSVSSSNVGGLNRLYYYLKPSVSPYSASSSMILFTPFFTTTSASGTAALIDFGTSTVNRVSFNSEISTSTSITVTVPAPDTTAPVRSAGLPSGAQAAGVTSVNLSLTTDEGATCRYSTVAGTAYGSMTAFSTTGGVSHSATLSGLTVASYNYYVRCQDSLNNANANDFTISFSITQSGGGGGGGGGGGSTMILPVTIINATSTASTTPVSLDNTASSTILTIENQNSSVVKLTDIEEEAKIISGRSEYINIDNASKNLYAKITAKKTLNQNQKYSLAYFIQNGTYLTKKLGAGERAGIVNSFTSAFGGVPNTEIDWQDVIKIGTGRWPGQKNVKTESNAKISFKKIYKREADMKNAHDNAAVTIIAYGLRSIKRNTVNEANSIKSFKLIYGKAPLSATDWDIIRAIAYSGAKR